LDIICEQKATYKLDFLGLSVFFGKKVTEKAQLILFEKGWETAIFNGFTVPTGVYLESITSIKGSNLRLLSLVFKFS